MNVYTRQVLDNGKRWEIGMASTPQSLSPYPLPPTPTDTIPPSVLQYERQMRKIRAAARAGAPVTKEEHLDVIHDDEYLVVTSKPSGVLCVPGVNQHPSLLTVVYQEYGAAIPDTMDKMIVHRLDMDTSGLVIFGKTMDTVRALHEAFRNKNVTKRYEALVCGHVEADSGLIDLPLQRDHKQPPFLRVATPRSEQEAAQAVQDLQTHGFKKLMRKKPKASQTEFSVLQREYLSDSKLPVTRLSLTPITGRTHQLRIHCAAMGHPIVGDQAYGVYGEASANGGFEELVMNQLAPHRASLALQQQINDLKIAKMCLHAKLLGLTHPVTKAEMKWEAPTPF